MEKKSYRLVITKFDFFEIQNSNIEKYIIFVYESDKLFRVQIFEKSKNLISSIYLAKVKNIVKNIEAAFLEIENKELVYFDMRKSSKNLKEGDELLVQIEKEALKTKQAVVSDRVNIKNTYSIVFIGKGNISFSSRLKSKRLKESIKLELDKIFLSNKNLEDMRTKFDIKIRTSFFDMKYFEDLKEEIILSFTNLNSYKKMAEFTKAPKLLKKGETVYTNIISDYFNDIEEVITDNIDVFNDIKSTFDERIKLRFYEDEKFSLAKLYSFKTILSDLISKKVYLNSGAYIIIESMETLNLIDVNTGKNINKNLAINHIYKINLEAAKEAVRQIILRNLSGIIIIDFINMKDETIKTKLIEFMENEFKKDKARVQIYGFTKLDLLEISRQKIYKTLRDSIFENERE